MQVGHNRFMLGLAGAASALALAPVMDHPTTINAAANIIVFFIYRLHAASAAMG
jgi:hypothetical protein